MAGYNWFDAATKGRNYGQAQDDRKLALLNNAEDRRRRITAENLAIQNDAEDRKETLFQIARLNKIRKAQENRNPTLINDFQYAGGNGYTGGAPSGDSTFAPVQVRYGTDASGNVDKNTVTYPGGSGQITGQATGQLPTATGQAPVIPGQVPVDTSVIPTFDTTPAADLERGRADAIKQGGEEYNTAIAGENKRFADVTSAKEMQQKHLASLQEKSYQPYLPKRARTDAANLGQFLNDRQLAAELDGVGQLIDSGKDVDYKGNLRDANATGTILPDWLTDPLGDLGRWLSESGTEEDSKKADIKIAELREARDWYESSAFGDSDSELYFMNNPGKWEEAKTYKGLNPDGTPGEGGFLKYYTDKIKPLIESGDAYTQVSDAGQFTQAQITEAKATHKDYMDRVAKGINSLDDDLKNANSRVGIINDEKVAAQKKLQKIYAEGLTFSNAKQAKKLEAIAIDYSLLDPTQLDGLAREKYEQRELLKHKAQNARKVANASGDWTEFDTLRAQITESDAALFEMLGHQGITDLKMNNDPRRISAVLSHFTNSKMVIQPRSDGTYNVISNGRIVGAPNSLEAIGELVGSYSSPEFRKRTAEYKDLNAKQQIKNQQSAKDNAKNMMDMMTSLINKKQEGMDARELEQYKATLKAMEMKFSAGSAGDGSGFFTSSDGTVIEYNPSAGVHAETGLKINPFQDRTAEMGDKFNDIRSQSTGGGLDIAAFLKEMSQGLQIDTGVLTPK